MAYTELRRINYSIGRINIEEVYINNPTLGDVIKTRLSKPKYVSVTVAPIANTAHAWTFTPSASLDVNARTGTLTSFLMSGTPQLIFRFIGV